MRQHANEYKLGDEIELTLMFKAKQSSTPTPLGKYATLILPYETCFGEFVRESASAQLSYAQLCDGARFCIQKHTHARTNHKKKDEKTTKRQLQPPAICHSLKMYFIW